MAEYVNKAELKQAVRNRWQDFETRVEVNYVVNCMPTIDIVTCKECVYEDCGMCSHIDHEWENHEADYYCSDGERRSDG